MKPSDEVLLLTPGPTPIHRRAAAAMQWPMRGHMDPEVFAFNDRVVADLHCLYGTAQGAFTALMAGTGSLGMEAGLANLLEPGDPVLIASNGVFGECMAAMAVRQGADVSVVRFDPGEPVDAEQVRRKALAIGPKLLAVVHGETSTGVINPVPELGHIAREVGALFSVNAVTTVGMLPFSMADWNIDYAYTGSQKCLSAPPGLAPVAFSKNAIDAVRNRRTAVTTWYADALDMMRYWLPSQEGRQYHHTVPVQLHWATGEAIRAALEEGVVVRARRVETLARAVLESLETIGCEAFVPESCRLPTVLAVRLPEGFDDQRVRYSLRFDHNISVAGGLGPTAGTIWRLGLMGENAHPDHYLRLMGALEQVLAVGGLRRRLERALVLV